MVSRGLEKNEDRPRTGLCFKCNLHNYVAVHKGINQCHYLVCFIISFKVLGADLYAILLHSRNLVIHIQLL